MCCLISPLVPSQEQDGAAMQPTLSADALTSALVRAVQQVTVTFMNWAGIGLLIQPLLFSAKEEKKKQEAEKRGAKS